MRKIFINSDSQIRSGWKLLLVVGLAIVLLLAMAILLEQLHISDPYGVTMFFSFIIAIAIMLKFIDKKDFTYIGLKSLRKYSKDLWIGLLAGAVFIVLNILILIVLGQASLSNSLLHPNLSRSVVTGFLLFILVGLAEEMLFRGYIIMAVQQMKRWWLSALVSALIFALTHGALNDNVSWLAVLNLFLGGLLLAYIFIRTGSIWMCVGFHITWNYFQGYILGIAVSGRTLDNALYTVTISEKQIAGGAFGLEGGLINTGVLICAFIFVWLYTKKTAPLPELDLTH